MFPAGNGEGSCALHAEFQTGGVLFDRVALRHARECRSKQDEQQARYADNNQHLYQGEALYVSCFFHFFMLKNIPKSLFTHLTIKHEKYFFKQKMKKITVLFPIIMFIRCFSAQITGESYAIPLQDGAAANR